MTPFTSSGKEMYQTYSTDLSDLKQESRCHCWLSADKKLYIFKVQHIL